MMAVEIYEGIYSDGKDDPLFTYHGVEINRGITQKLLGLLDEKSPEVTKVLSDFKDLKAGRLTIKAFTCGTCTREFLHWGFKEGVV